MRPKQRRGSPTRQDGGLRRTAAVLLQAALLMGILVGCVVAPRPADGTLDLPHFANQEEREIVGFSWGG
jgi:hypothetical protein